MVVVFRMVHVPTENLLSKKKKTGCGSKNPLRPKIGNYFAWGLMEQGLLKKGASMQAESRKQVLCVGRQNKSILIIVKPLLL